MKAIICTKYGPPEVLKIQQVPKPVPKKNEVLIKIMATTAHVGDARIRRFDVPKGAWLPARLMLGLTKPRKKILGMELAGTIESVGNDVTRFITGDRVCATPGFKFGTYAEYICLSEKGMITHMPENMSFEEAPPLTAGGITALIVLRKASIKNGQKVLIYGASGSVGTFAVQLAKHYFGAEVTGVSSTTNLDMVRSIGADSVIDYTKEDFTKNGPKYDVVFDAVDKISATKGKEALKKGGVYLNVGKDSGSDKHLKAQDLEFLMNLVVAGKLKSVIDRTYPFENIVEAHRYVDKGHKKGNVIIIVAED